MSDLTLRSLLYGYRYATLLRMASFHGLHMPDPAFRPSKQALIEFLQQQWSTPEHAAQALEHLTALERTVLDRLLQAGSDVDTQALREALHKDGIVHPAARANLHAHDQPDPLKDVGDSFEDIVSRLTLHGLVLSSNIPPSCVQKGLGFTPGLRLTIPQPVRRHLPSPGLLEVEWGHGSVPAPVSQTGLDLAQRELFVYWTAVRHEPLTLTHSGLLQKRSLRNIHQKLVPMVPAMEDAPSEAASPHLHFLRLLLQELGVLVRRGRQICASVQPNEIPVFWEQPLERRARSTLNAWLRMSRWSELASLRLSSLHLDLPRARTLLVEQLALLSPEIWISSERFLNRLAAVVPCMIFQPRGNEYVDEAHLEEALDRQNRRLAEIEGAFVDAALRGPLHWMGIVDIAADGDRLVAFRLNSGGACTLSTQSCGSEPPTETGKVIVQPNFHILVLGSVPTAILARVEMFAERTKIDRRAFEYVLTRESIYQAEKSQMTVGDVISFLKAHCSVPVPNNVVRTVQEWGEQHERIIFHRRVSLCQSDTAGSLQGLFDNPTIRPHLQRQLTPTIAIVRKGHMRTLQERLLQHGVLPAISPTDSSCVGRVQATPDGELRPLHDGPDLLLVSCLRHLTEDRDSRFYVTEQAVKQALSRGMTIVQYLEELSRIHHGPVPGALQIRIKTWGHYYGPAKLEQATLLELKDATMASELLADEKLARWLSRFAEDPRGRTLLVRADDLASLRQLLRERGIELT